MSEAQTLKEAWADAEQWFMGGQDDLRDAVRALLLVGLEETRDYQMECDGCKPDDPCGYHYLYRCIEELGR